MKTKLFTTALAALLSLALAGTSLPVQADNSTTTTSPTEKKFTASIKSISTKSITVEVKKKLVTLDITPKTHFKKDKVAATESAFGVGDKVTVCSKGKVAKSIDLGT